MICSKIILIEIYLDGIDGPIKIDVKQHRKIIFEHAIDIFYYIPACFGPAKGMDKAVPK